MKRVFLILGEPDSGKTYLAQELKQNHSFATISLDELYVEFIKTRCAFLYFSALNLYIAPHYKCILKAQAWSVDKFKRDFVREWHDHLVASTEAAIASHDDLAVEGFLLYDCVAEIESQFSSSDVKVSRIYVVNRRYRVLGRPITVQEIGALGSENKPS